MSLFLNPVYVATVLLLLVWFAQWLCEKKGFRYLGASLIVIIAAAILANVGLLPSSGAPSPLYGGIFSYAAPLAIFYLLLDVRLNDLKTAGLPALLLFFAGSITTIIGVLAGYYLLSPGAHGVEKTFAVAGMYTGTYTGGSANLNAVGLQYRVNENGTLFAAINAADNIVGTVWIILTIGLPVFLQRWLPRKKVSINPVTDIHEPTTRGSKEILTIKSLSVLLTLGFASLLLSQLISEWLPQVPSILTLTTLAILLAQLPLVSRLGGANVLGFFLVLVFLAVVGAFCDVQALVQSGDLALTLLLWVTVIVFLHGVLLFLIGGLLKQDWAVVAMASNANIGGTATAAALAASLKRPDLRLPGILIGSVGNAVGTYLGIAVAEMLR